MTYSIGDPRDPLPSDLRFATQEAAEIAALNQIFGDGSQG